MTIMTIRIPSTLRESLAAMTSRQITELWAHDRGLRADEATLTTIRKRIGACIQTCVTQGLLECAGQTTSILRFSVDFSGYWQRHIKV